MATRISSREFNQDTSKAKKAAEKGPVYITDRGRPAHVLRVLDRRVVRSEFSLGEGRGVLCGSWWLRT